MRQNVNSIGNKCADALGTFVEKSASRKWVSWIVGTHLTYLGVLDPSLWFSLTLVFLGVQGALDWQKRSQETPPG